MTTNTNTYRIFVASSLNLVEERKNILNLAKELNEDADKNKAAFSVFGYEMSDDILQIYNEIDAQQPIGQHLENSTFFVLIIDAVVGSKTIEEFLKAKDLFERRRLPACIFVFVKDYRKKECTIIPTGTQITYEEFERHYNAYYRIGNHHGEIEAYNKVYPIPYDTADDIKRKLKRELQKWYTSPYHRPLIGAKLGSDIVKEDFYCDQERINSCRKGLYFKRRFDDELNDCIESHKPFVSLFGTSLSGKTRALLHAVHKNANQWFYVFPTHDVEKMVSEIYDVSHYIQNTESPIDLTFIFDDVNLRDDFGSAFDSAFDYLVSQIKHVNLEKGRKHGILYTTSIDAAIGTEISERDLTRISIPPMKDDDFFSARLYFSMYGYKIHEANMSYRTTGALLIDIERIGMQYENFVKKYNRDNHKYANDILYAIKGLSIWHRFSLGDIQEIKDFCRVQLNGYGTNTRSFSLSFDEMIDYLCKKCAGIIRNPSNPNYLIIEEYIYRYFINTAGGITYNSTHTTKNRTANLTNTDLADEYELVYNIMDYSYKTNREPLMDTASKLSRRADHQDEVSAELFKIWDGANTREGWSKALYEERLQVENGDYGDGNKYFMAYMRLHSIRILGARDFSTALNVYNSVSVHGELNMEALIRKTQGEDDLRKVLSLPEFKRMSGSPIIRSRMAWMSKDFKFAYQWLIDYPLPNEDDYYDALEKVRIKNDADNKCRVLVNTVRWYSNAIERLFNIVSNPEQFEKTKSLIRDHYCLLVNDRAKAAKLRDNALQMEGLTLYALMENVSSYSIQMCFMRIFKSNMDTMTRFFKEQLISKARQAYCQEKIPKYEIQRIGSAIGCAMINSQKGLMSMTEAMEKFFLPLSFDVDSNTRITLWSPYTLTALMEYDDCTFWKATELLQHYITANVETRLINQYVLNAYILFAVKENSPIIYQRTLELFDKLGVKRDVYTYNILIRHADYNNGIAYFKDMLNQGIPPDCYTLSGLIANAPDIATAMSYFSLPEEVKGEKRGKKTFNGDMSIYREMEKMGVRNLTRQMAKNIYAWCHLFEHACTDDSERQAMKRCLEYIQDNRAELLPYATDANITNVYNLYLRNALKEIPYQEKLEFVSEMKLTKGVKPDVYTYKQLILSFSNIKSLNNKDRKELINVYRDAYNTLAPSQLSMLYEYRLRFFSDYSRAQPCVLPMTRPDETEMLTPLQYVQRLIKMNVKIRSGLIRQFWYIGERSVFSKDVVKKLFEYVIIPQKVNLDVELIQKIRYKYLIELHWDDSIVVNSLNSMVDSLSVDSINKQVMHDFTNDTDGDFIDYAGMIDRRNALSALFAYNTILDTWHQRNLLIHKKQKYGNRADAQDIAQENTVKIGTDEYFNQAMLYIKKFYIEPVVLDAKTISILAGIAYHKEQLYSVLSIGKSKKVKGITIHFLTNCLNKAHNINEVKQLYQCYMDLGGDCTSSILSPLVINIERIAKQSSDADACVFMEEVSQCVLTAETFTFSEKIHNVLPWLKTPLALLVNKSNVDMYILKAVLRFKSIGKKYCNSIPNIFDVLLKLYPHIFLKEEKGKSFLEFILCDKYISIPHSYYPQLFNKTARVAGTMRINKEFLTEIIKEIQTWDDYCCIVEACYLIHIKCFDSIATFLYDALWRLAFPNMQHPPRIRTTNGDAMRLWQRISSYAPIPNKLRTGHFLPHGNTQNFEDAWMQQSITHSVAMYSKCREYQRRSNYERITQDVAQVPDSYFVALWILANENIACGMMYAYRDGALMPSTFALKLQEYEQDYIPLIQNGSRSLPALATLATNWIKTGFLPCPDIVLAIIQQYVEISEGSTDMRKVAIHFVQKIRKWQKEERDKIRDENANKEKKNRKWEAKLRFPLALLQKKDNDCPPKPYVLLSTRNLDAILSTRKKVSK